MVKWGIYGVDCGVLDTPNLGHADLKVGRYMPGYRHAGGKVHDTGRPGTRHMIQAGWGQVA